MEDLDGLWTRLGEVVLQFTVEDITMPIPVAGVEFIRCVFCALLVDVVVGLEGFGRDGWVGGG